MGKGGGRGGCQSFVEGTGSTLACACCILFAGPIFMAIGISLLAAAKDDDRGRAIDRVVSAATAWKGSDNTSLSSFGGLELYAQVGPASRRGSCANDISNYTVRLLESTQVLDFYQEEQSRLGSYPQKRYSSPLLPSAVEGCGWQVAIMDGGSGNATVAQFIQSNDYMDFSLNPSYGRRFCPSSFTSCASSDARACQSNCEDNGGTWSCGQTGPRSYSCSARWYFNDMCVKISRGPAGGWRADGSRPSGGQGCSNLAPAIRASSTTAFQIPNATQTWWKNPARQVSLTVRSAYDPWLMYMVTTEGSGQFGTSKGDLVRGGATLLVIGVFITLGYAAIGWFIYKACSGRMPAQRPTGMLNGRAWDVAHRYGYVATGYPVYGPGQTGPAMGGEYQMSQMYGMPPPQGYPAAAGYPHPGYPPPGAYPPPHYPQGAYPMPYPGTVSQQPQQQQPQPGWGASGSEPMMGYPASGSSGPAHFPKM